ncbi:MAG: DUF433 domain-containing protein [Acidimicrobiales bacterium]
MTFDPIAIDRRITGGVPCIRGTRLPGASLKATIAEGTTTAEVLNEFLQLAEDEVREALRIAAAVDEHGLLPRGIR